MKKDETKEMIINYIIADKISSLVILCNQISDLMRIAEFVPDKEKIEDFKAIGKLMSYWIKEQK